MNSYPYETGSAYRHLLLLEELECQGNVSQRRLAERLGIAASLINRLIAELVESGFVDVVDPAVRPFAYRVSPAGRDYRTELSDAHLRSVVGTFREVQQRIRDRLGRMKGEGIRRVVFYGAGDVMDVTYPLAQSLGLEVIALVDDDPDKWGATKGELVVGSPSQIKSLKPDAVVITTFRHAPEVQMRLAAEWECPIQTLEL